MKILVFFIFLMKMHFCRSITKMNMEEKHTDSSEEKNPDHSKEAIFLRKFFTSILRTDAKKREVKIANLNTEDIEPGIIKKGPSIEHEAPSQEIIRKAKHSKYYRKKRDLNFDLDLGFNSPDLSHNTDRLIDMLNSDRSSNAAITSDSGSSTDFLSSESSGRFNPTDASNPAVIQMLPAGGQVAPADQKLVTTDHENKVNPQANHVNVIASNQQQDQQFKNDLDDSQELDETMHELEVMLSNIIRQLPDDGENSNSGNHVPHQDFGDTNNVPIELDDKFIDPYNLFSSHNDDDKHGGHEDDIHGNVDGLDDIHNDLDAYDAVLPKMKVGAEEMKIREMINKLDSIMKEGPKSEVQMENSLFITPDDEGWLTADTHLFDKHPLFEDFGSGTEAKKKAQSKSVQPINVLSDLEKKEAENNHVFNNIISSVPTLGHVGHGLSLLDGAAKTDVKITQESSDGTEIKTADIAAKKDETTVHVSHHHKNGSSQWDGESSVEPNSGN